MTHHIEEVLPVFTHTFFKDGTVFKQGRREEVITDASMSEMYGRAIRSEMEAKQTVYVNRVNLPEFHF